MIYAVSLMIFLIISFPCNTLWAKTIYVETNGSDLTGDGSESKPYSSIQMGLNQAESNYTVMVGEGIFYENIEWPTFDGISLIGKGESISIIDGGQNNRVIIIDKENKSALLKDIKIQNGNGGLYCYIASLNIANVSISNNSTEENGGGIYCEASSLTLTNVSISNNSTEDYGGGIYCRASNLTLTNVSISNNSTENDGGGIYCTIDYRTCRKSRIYLTNVIITNNQSNSTGGGIYCAHSTLNFDKINRGSIYFNNAKYGNDIYTNTTINLNLDSFSVKYPTSNQSLPINLYEFDILQGKEPQKNFDLYVNPNGDNSNIGNSPDSPLKSIHYALSVIQANEQNPHTIYLASGIYSTETNEEIFPIRVVDFVNIEGGNINNTIIDGNNENIIFTFYDINKSEIKNINIVNGNDSAIFCYKSSPSISNIFITGCIGYGLFANNSSNINLSNVSIINNTGNGFELYRSSSTIVNSLIWNNTLAEVRIRAEIRKTRRCRGIKYGDRSNSEATISSSAIQYGKNDISLIMRKKGSARLDWHPNNIETDPMFINPQQNDYRLQPNSPCIDAGSPDTDNDGLTWKNDPDDRDPDGSRKDIGAFFCQRPFQLSVPDTIIETVGTLQSAGNISIPFIPYDDISVRLRSRSNKVVLPETVTIPAELTSTNFDIKVIDDLPYMSQSITITASAPYFITTNTLMSVTDAYIRKSDLSCSHENNRTWSNDNNIRISWNNPSLREQVSGYSYQINTNEEFIPDHVIDTTESTISVNVDDSYNHWFHMHAIDNHGKVGHTVHVGPFKIDTKEPLIKSFNINQDDLQSSIQEVYLYLDAVDNLSGVSQVNISNSDYGEGNWQDFQSILSWTLPGEGGEKTVFIQVKDEAGNISKTFDSIKLVCEFAVIPVDVNLNILEQSREIHIYNQASCFWAANINEDWVSIVSNAFGTGDGCIDIVVNNPGKIEQKAVLTIADKKIHLNYAPKLPDIPEAFISNDNQGSIQISWDLIKDDQVLYNVYRSEFKGGVYYPINSFPIDIFELWPNKSFVDFDVEPGKTYCYDIKAENADGYTSNLKEPICQETQVLPDYEVIFDTYPQAITNIGGTVSYTMTIMKKSLMGSLDISCSGLPESMKYNLKIGDIQGTSIHHFDQLPAKLGLKIELPGEIDPKEYPFDISFQNVWETGGSKRRVYPLSILAVQENKGGIIIVPEKEECFFGETVKLYGMIFPPLNYHDVHISIIDESGTRKKLSVTTGEMPFFEDSTVVKTLTTGKYEIYAQFTDQISNTYKSTSKSLVVNKQKSELTLFELDDNNILSELNPDQDYRICGKLVPNLSNQEITLKVFLSTYAYKRTFSYSIYSGPSGEFELSRAFFKHKGFYQIKAYWQGDENNIGCESNFLIKSTGSPGLAIILGGGTYTPHNGYAKATKKLTTKMYQNLKKIGYNDESIYFMINTDMIDIDDDGLSDRVVDETSPSLSIILNLLEDEFVSTLDADSPLFVYIQGHGTEGGKVELFGGDYLTPDILLERLDAIQDSTGCTVILLLEFCYSGKYLETLSRDNRLIFTSVDAYHQYPTEEDGLDFFTNHFLEKIISGDSLEQAFISARENSGPVPQMDDNGDKLYNDQDGLLAANIHLGNTYLWSKPKIIDISAPVLLNANETTASISLTVNEDQQYIKEVFAKIMTPQDQNNMTKDMSVSYKKQLFHYTPDNQRFEANITHLDQPGVYKIVLYAKKADLEMSEPQFLYIRTAHEYATNDLNKDLDVSIDDVVYGLQQLCNDTYTDIRLADVLQCFIQLSRIE